MVSLESHINQKCMCWNVRESSHISILEWVKHANTFKDPSLSERSFTVCMNQVLCETSVLPQGSVLGPILFFVFIYSLWPNYQMLK